MEFENGWQPGKCSQIVWMIKCVVSVSLCNNDDVVFDNVSCPPAVDSGEQPSIERMQYCAMRNS
jgi:hypothetical protein